MSNTTYTFDPMHTTVLWQCNHFGFSTPKGQFTMIEGKIEFDEQAPVTARVNVSIDSTTLSTGIEIFNEHLAGKDFFNSEQFPTITFISKKVEVSSKNTFKVHGLLTLLGITKPVILDAVLNKIGEHPMTKKNTVGFSATALIKRSDFGMVAYIPMVGDDVKLSIEAEAAV